MTLRRGKAEESSFLVQIFSLVVFAGVCAMVGYLLEGSRLIRILGRLFDNWPAVVTLLALL